MRPAEFLAEVPEEGGRRRPSRESLRAQIARELDDAHQQRAATKRRAKARASAETFDPFPALCVAQGLERPVKECRFHPDRQWRIDYAWPERKVGLEVDGGVWTGGRHTRGGDWHRDTEKLNAAHEAGWRMLRCTPETLCTDATVASVRATLEASTR